MKGKLGLPLSRITSSLIPLYIHCHLLHMRDIHSSVGGGHRFKPVAALIYFFSLKNAIALIAFQLRGSFHSFYIISVGSRRN